MAPKPQDLTTTGQNTAGTSLTEYIKAQRTAVAKLTGADSREADAYIQEAVTEVWMRPELQSCEKKSIIGACLQAWSLKLHVGTAMGEAALVPYKGKCVFQIMQKGLQTLFYNHESAVHLDARIVYEKDYFDMDLGTAHQLVHKPCLEQDRGKIRGYYAIALMRKIDPSTRLPFEYYVWTDLWTPEQIKAWAHQYSASYRSYESGQSGEKNAWKTSFDGMALKTMKKQLAKTLPMSTTMRKALAADDSIKSFRNDEMNPLDQPDEFDYDKDEPTIIETTAEVVETKEEKVPPKSQERKREEKPKEEKKETPPPVEDVSGEPTPAAQKPEQTVPADFINRDDVKWEDKSNSQKLQSLLDRVPLAEDDELFIEAVKALEGYGASPSSTTETRVGQVLQKLFNIFGATEKQKMAFNSMLKKSGKSLQDYLTPQQGFITDVSQLTKMECSKIYDAVKQDADNA